MTTLYNRFSLIVGLTLLTAACAQDLPSGVTSNTVNQASTTPANVTQVSTVDPVSTETGPTTTPIATVTPLSLSLSSSTPPANSAVTLAASGGTAPYTYSVGTAVGTLSGSTFFTAAISETVVLTVRDSAGLTASASLTSQAPVSIPIYRFAAGLTHFFSTSNSEGLASGMRLDGVGYHLLQSSGNNTTALYRCTTGSLFYETTDSHCEGNGNPSATLGYVYVTQAAGTVPLYRYVNSAADHIDSPDGSIGGYISEGVLGYVPTN